jgi:hypothetical protein
MHSDDGEFADIDLPAVRKSFACEGENEMTVKIDRVLVQGSEEWSAARCGLLTASEMHLIVTPTLKAASNDKERAHLYELLAQRITRYVEPRYVSDDMLRGQEDEITAAEVYAKEYAPIERVGFITNDRFGFAIGYSPDFLVGDDGLGEIKSRAMKHQIKTLIHYAAADAIDPDFVIQAQTGLLVSERKWVDHISYCGGLPMCVVRVFPDDKIQQAIIEAATSFEDRLTDALSQYDILLASDKRLVQTERRIEQEMHL